MKIDEFILQTLLSRTANFRSFYYDKNKARFLKRVNLDTTYRCNNINLQKPNGVCH